MFYDLFEELCREREVSPTRAALEMGISRGTPSTWKRRGHTPHGETLNKISAYFGVSIDYLLGKAAQRWPQEGRPIREEDMKVAFFADTDVPEEEMEVLWQDAKDYIHFKMNQRRNQQ